MPSWLPSVPYPALKQGYWLPETSTINWCEEDYYATIYAAEIVNTLTNLLFMLLAFKGIRSCLANDHDRIFLVTFLGYLLVGTGSFLFHATLKYPMQLVDELSMIYTTCLMCYATFSHKQKHPLPLILGISLISLALFITGYYHYLQDPAFHQNAYALLTATVVFRAMYIMEVNIRPSFNKKRAERQKLLMQRSATPQEETEQKRQDVRDAQILKAMWFMIACGLSIFLGGFGIWTLDNVYCSKIRRWRHEIGLPWGILLEGHGWWHVMTGIGAYFYITWGLWLRHCLNDKHDEYKLVWLSILSLPEVVRAESAPPNAVPSGISKKML